MRCYALGFCCCALFVLSSCVETLDLPMFNSSPHSDWGSGRPVSSSVSVEGTRAAHKPVNSEFLLEEDGVWNLVEQSKSYDPAQAHLQARRNVDTSRRRHDSSLAAHFEPDAKSGQDGKLRVLRLDAGKGGYDMYEDIQVSESSFVKPANTVAGVEQFMRESPGGAVDAIGVRVGVVRPPSLPVRKRIVGDVSQSIALASSSETKVINNGRLASGISTVSGIRAGMYNGRVRLVIEIRHATHYKVAVDHLRNVLRLKLDRAALNMRPQGTLTDSNSLFGTYIAKEQGDNSVLLEVRLKKASQIIDTMILRPNASSNYRVVVDMNT